MSIPFLSKVASKQIHITTEPAPRNLSESRLVLKALQKFGEVVYFYNLRYERQLKFRNSGRSVYAIFESEDSVNAAIAASPLRIKLPESDSPTTTTPKTRPSKSKYSKTGSTSGERPPAALECTINRSDYDHADAVRQNPYYNTFSLTTNNLEFQDLSRKDGSGGVPLREFADCFTGRKRAHPFRIQERVLEENRRMGVDSLMGLWREGQEKERMEGGKGEGKREGPV
ncbi:hypothetical protein FQN54_005551 [Arachnomyces sp. PD_36]|nr:hypothetical protein FQN54_005551 [Arachnomyces sp. PD_36]